MNTRQTSMSFDPAQIDGATQAADLQDQAKPLWQKLLTAWAGPLIVFLVLAPFVPGLARWVSASDVGLTAPDFGLLVQIPLAVQVHLATVVIALPLGAWMLYAPKGTAMHKALGRVWVAAMAITCISALFIKSFAPVLGPFGFIHLLVLWTLYSLAAGMWAIIVKKDLAAHLRNLRGAWWGLIIAGLFSAIPGRLLWSMFTTM